MAFRPRINGFVFNHVGTDTNEHIEVKADPGADLSSYRLLVIDGDTAATGVIGNLIAPGTADASGYWVTPFLNNQLQNGSQTVLLVQGYTGPAAGALPTAARCWASLSAPWAS